MSIWQDTKSALIKARSYEGAAEIPKYRAVVRGTAANQVKLPSGANAPSFSGFTLETGDPGTDHGVHLAGGVALATAGSAIAFGDPCRIAGATGKIETGLVGRDHIVCYALGAAAADGDVLPVLVTVIPIVGLKALDGSKANDQADDAVVPAIPVEFVVAIPDAASGDKDLVLPAGMKIEVIEVVAQKRAADSGANANTLTVKNGANAITNALDMQVVDKTLVRAGTIDDAQSTIAGGGTLRVSWVKAGGNSAAQVTIRALRRA